MEGSLGVFGEARHRDRSIWQPRVRQSSFYRGIGKNDN